MKSKLPQIFSALSLLFLCACSLIFGETEFAMTPGMVIEAKTHLGDIKIEANNKLTRTYSWNSFQKQFSLSTRWQRWNGSKGLYRSSGDRTMHAVLGEGQQHFFSEEDVYPWLQLQTYNGRRALVYTSDGLVVFWQWQKHPTENTSALSVEVWQIYIQGKKPENMKGAKSDQIKVFFKDGYEPKYPPKGNFEPSSPKIINGYLFSGKAVDHMKEKKRKFVNTEKKVIKLIKFGKQKKKGEYITYYGTGDRFDPFEDLHWVKLDKEGRVVLFD